MPSAVSDANQLGVIYRASAWWCPLGAHGSHRTAIPLLSMLIDYTCHLRKPISWENGSARSHQTSKYQRHQACGCQGPKVVPG